MGVAVLGDFLYAVGGQDGVSCLNYVERLVLVFYNSVNNSVTN